MGIGINGFHSLEGFSISGFDRWLGLLKQVYCVEEGPSLLLQR